jgi:hypothetical protein
MSSSDSNCLFVAAPRCVVEDTVVIVDKRTFSCEAEKVLVENCNRLTNEVEKVQVEKVRWDRGPLTGLVFQRKKAIILVVYPHQFSTSATRKTDICFPGKKVGNLVVYPLPKSPLRNKYY